MGGGSCIRAGNPENCKGVLLKSVDTTSICSQIVVMWRTISVLVHWITLTGKYLVTIYITIFYMFSL